MMIPRARVVMAMVLLLSTPALAQQIKIFSGQKWPLESQGRNARNARGLLTVDAPHLNGAVLLNGRINGATIGPVRIINAYRAVETNEKVLALRNIVIDGLIAEGIEREGIRLRGNVDNVIIRNFKLTHAERPNDMQRDLPEGIHIESGTNITIENGDISGFQMTLDEKRYWNGDGVAIEGGVNGIVIRNVKADNNTDAGFDLKSSNTHLDNIEASGNKRNIRIWNGATAGKITIGDILKRGGNSTTAGLWIRGNPKNPIVTIKTFVVRMTKPGPIIVIEDGPAQLKIDECDIQAPPGSVLLATDKTIDATMIELGRGCKL